MKIMSKPPENSAEEKKGNYFCGWLKWKKAVAVNLRWNRLLQTSRFVSCFCAKCDAGLFADSE